MLLSAKSMYFSALTAISAAGAAILSALGGWDDSLQFLIGIMAVDYLLGILIALVWHKSQKTADGTFESNASLKGLFRKFSVLLIVYVAVQLDIVANTGGYLRTAVILFFVANEGFSIIENFGIMGVPMPEQVKDAFAAIKSKAEKTE
ncbi:phage holin family protein [Clostridium merdae]|uniref:phage holin family protein n=1 Tax=Clostridium merdae TaxID=1958780 RepID=UPI0013565B65|nr:phage holin family protein [Clostridium merdae]